MKLKKFETDSRRKPLFIFVLEITTIFARNEKKICD